MDRYGLDIPDTPPSLNRVGSRGRSHWAFTTAKKRWEGMLGIALMKNKVPRGLLRVEATASLRFPSQRRRDEGNYRMMLEKALGDILVSGGWLDDDDVERFTFGELKIEPVRGQHRTRVLLIVERQPLAEAA